MPELELNQHPHYYEAVGDGRPMIFVHGAFVDARMWDPQWSHFSKQHHVVRYDLRGHGKTGPSDLKTYTIGTFGDDLHELIRMGQLNRPILVGISLGGMIAQEYAVRSEADLGGLILADTAVSVSLTLMDKLQRYVLFPKWVMQLSIKMLSVEGFTRFSFWLARMTRSEAWLGRDPATRKYVRQTMLAMDQQEYLKVYDAIYGFKLLPLERITCPTLVLNGEHESGSVFRHTEEIKKKVPAVETTVVPAAGHTSNMENAHFFNQCVADFIQRRC